MRNRIMWPVLVGLILVSGAALAVPSLLRAQAEPKTPETQPAQGTKSTKSGQAFDPHDLAGVWDLSQKPMPNADDFKLPRADNPGGGTGMNVVPKDVAENFMTPWAREKWMSQDGGKGQGGVADPLFVCDPVGIPRVMSFIHPFEIVQEPGKTWMIYEANHMWRVIYTDGRPIPKLEDLPFGPTWLGYSVGHWEGDEFVVDTVGMNDKTWLDQIGHAHSEQLHLTDRYHRVSHDVLEVSFTFDDPKAYSKVWTFGPRVYNFKTGPQWEIQESFCTLAEQQQFKATQIKQTDSAK